MRCIRRSAIDSASPGDRPSNSFVGAREREQAAYGFKVRPEEMIFLDDMEPNIAAARAVGIHGVHYRDNAQAITEIEALLTRAGD